MRDAMQVEGLQLRRRDDVADGDFFRSLGERVSPAGATRALHDSRTTETQQNLLDVIHRQTFALREIATRDRTLPNSPREMESANHTVFRERRYAHESTLTRRLSGRHTAVRAAGNSDLRQIGRASCRERV